MLKKKKGSVKAPKSEKKLTKEVILEALNKAALAYDRTPHGAVRKDVLEKIADGLLSK